MDQKARTHAGGAYLGTTSQSDTTIQQSNHDQNSLLLRIATASRLGLFAWAGEVRVVGLEGNATLKLVKGMSFTRQIWNTM